MTNRIMSVKIGETVSSPFQATSGVPQGSHLGPYIFLLYLNDINFCLKCYKLSYADDFKLFWLVNNEEDAKFLQEQLHIFEKWCVINRMVLNPLKCSVVTFSRKKLPTSFEYKLHGEILNRFESIKDLGIMLDSKLTFRDHIAYIVNKSSKTLGFVFRATKKFKDPLCIKALYCALVRSILEYGCVVWSPHYQNGVQRIEAIQRKFVRFALRNLPWSDPWNLPNYEDRCKLLGIDILSVRRDVAKASFLSDLILGNIDCAELLQLIDFNVRHRNLRSHYFLRLPNSRTNYGYNEPVSSMCRILNRCYSSFDLHLPRSSLKTKFTLALRQS